MKILKSWEEIFHKLPNRDFQKNITLGFKKVSQNKEFDWSVAISRYGLCSVFMET